MASGCKRTLGEEDAEGGRLANALLKLAHVVELLDVQPEAHARAQQLQLAHERVRLILPRAPSVAHESVEGAAPRQLEARLLAV